MSKSTNEDTDAYLRELKEQGAELLVHPPAEGTIEHARLSLIDAKIEQLTNPIVCGDWRESGD